MPLQFVLDDRNSQRMLGTDDPVNERWADVAGNFYSGAFVSRFSYEKPSASGPIVRVRVEPEAPTLTGRLEARGLKPNFAYQMKLRGVFADRWSFEAIGYVGRWRLPGRDTNYSDVDYRDCPFQERVEAYLLFDFFVTDSHGDAVRDFALDSSLHVLWNGVRQRWPASLGDLVPVIVDATDAETYARPKKSLQVEQIWAERETARYRRADQKTFLPPGRYAAELVLTEESFHSKDNDGGWWATPCRCPIEFTVTGARPSPAPK